MAFEGPVGRLFVSIGADVGAFDKGMSHVQQKMASTAGDVQRHGNAIGGAFGKIGGAVGGLVDGLGKLGLAGMGVQAIGSTVGGLVMPFIDANSQMQTFETTLTTVFRSMAGTEEKAREMARDTLEWARTFAATTPFEIPQIVEATTRLQAYGLNARDVLESTGNMAAAMGKPLMQAVEAIADAQTGELERLKEFGITKKMLIEQAAEMGKGEIVNAQGQITNMAALNEALFALMDERFAGGMERQSKTFAGMMSNVQDFMGTMTRTIGAPIFERVSGALQGLLTLINEHQEDLTAFGEAVGEKIGQGFDFVAETAQNLLPYLQDAVSTFGSLWEIVQLLITGDFKGGIFGWMEDDSRIDFLFRLRDAVGAVWTLIQDFVNYFSAGNEFDLMGYLFGPDLGPRIDEVVRAVKSAFETIQIMISGLGKVLSGELSFGEWLGENIDRVNEVGPRLISAINELIESAIPVIASKLKEWAEAFIAWIAPMIPPFLAQLGKLVDQLISWIVQSRITLAMRVVEWAEAFLDWIQPMIDEFLAQWPGMLRAFLAWIESAVPPLMEKIGQWAAAFIDWVGPHIPVLLGKLGELAGAILGFIGTTLEILVPKLVEWGGAFVGWVLPQIPVLLGKLGELLGAMLGWIGNTGLPLLSEKLAAWAESFSAWIYPVRDDLLGELGKLLSAIGNWIVNTALPQLATWALQMGKALLDGIVNGLGNLADAVGNKLSSGLEGAVNAAKQKLGIESPSKIMAEMGRNMVSGLIDGLQNLGADTGQELTNQMDEAMDAFARYIDFVVEDGDTLNDWLTHLPEGVRPAVQRMGESVNLMVSQFGVMGQAAGKSLVNAIQASVLEMPPVLATNMGTAVGEALLQMSAPVTTQVETDMAKVLQGGFLRATEGTVDPIARDMEKALAGGLARATEPITQQVEEDMNKVLQGGLLRALETTEDALGAGELASKVGSVGGAIIDGLVKGMEDVGATAAAGLGSILNRAVQAGRDVLEAESPSKVMARMGKDMLQGLTLGLSEGAQAFNEAFRQLLSQPIQAWEKDFTNIFDWFQDKAVYWAKGQIDNLRGVFGEILAGSKGLEDLIKVLDNMYGNLDRLISPLRAIAELQSAEAIAAYEDGLAAINDELAAKAAWYKEEIATQKEMQEGLRARYDEELDAINETIAAIQSKIDLESGAASGRLSAASIEQEALQKEINRRELEFAIRREEASGIDWFGVNEEKLKAIDAEERAYKDSVRTRMDLLRAQVQVARDEIDTVKDRHQAELDAAAEQKAAAKEQYEEQLASIKEMKAITDAAYENEKKRLETQRTLLKEQRDAALELNTVYQDLQKTIEDLQARIAEQTWIKSIVDIITTLSNAGIGISQSLLDAFAKIPRTAGESLDLLIKELIRAYGGTLPSFDLGGTVPGPLGSPQLVMAHGGEQISPPGQGRQIVNNYYLTANYRYESERSLMDDVKLLQLLGSVSG